MALPVAPGPRTQDVAVSGWGALTVPVAWTLLACGVNIRPQVLRDARDHLLYHLDPSATVAHAEDQADIHTRRFVANARRQRLDEQWPQDWAMPLSPRWRDALERTLTPLTQAVLRQHYADARPMADLASALQVDRITLEGARGGLREVVRHAACTDGVPLDEWPVERLDKLIARLAAFTPTRCPDPRTLPEAERGRHASYCPRCSRTLRLLAAEVLSDGDLEPPLGTARPRHHCTVLALNLHPDGRQHRKTLVREADFPCFPAGEDLLLMDWTSPGEATELLVLATQVATPRREHLRGVVLSGPGRWSRHGLLGPLATEAERAVRSRAWGTVDTLGELPDALPSPPSAARLWVGTLALAAVALLGVQAALGAGSTGPDHQLEVAFHPGRGGIWSDFDVAEQANVTLVRSTPAGLDIVLDSRSPADKAALATGDGAYRLHTLGDGVLLASTSTPLPDLPAMLAAAKGAPDPLVDLRVRIQQADPKADVRVGRP